MAMATLSPCGSVNLGLCWPRQCSTLIRFTIKTTPFRSHRFQWERNCIFKAVDESVESVRQQQTILQLGHEVFPKTGRLFSTDSHPDCIYSIDLEEAIA